VAQKSSSQRHRSRIAKLEGVVFSRVSNWVEQGFMFVTRVFVRTSASTCSWLMLLVCWPALELLLEQKLEGFAHDVGLVSVDALSVFVHVEFDVLLNA